MLKKGDMIRIWTEEKPSMHTDYYMDYTSGQIITPGIIPTSVEYQCYHVFAEQWWLEIKSSARIGLIPVNRIAYIELSKEG